MNKKYAILAIAAVLILAGIIIWGVKYYKKPGEIKTFPISTSTSESQTTSTQEAAQPKTTAGAVKTLSYEEAINKYINRRIQFNNNCQANPTSFVLKNGTSFMIDNRSGKGQNFYVDAKKYYIKGYGFQIFTIKKSVLPYTIRIDCGSGKNNAQVILN